ncbi:complement C1q-like protein 3 [Ruditapes philippinarum]|uniref:complement C1q-like protein 3 n=1 Tax=Ruditapes philippinarum TaxID=129788 RepID=UPI00295C2221|nr:complement C1q-like protein 3 [Ruditapes philippinarum]
MKMSFLALIVFAVGLTSTNAFVVSGNISNSDVSTLLKLISNEQSMRLQLETKLQKLEEQVQALTNNSAVVNKNGRQVAFSGELQHNIETFNRTLAVLKFVKVITNIGNAYNTTTGIFHCPVSGLYLFYLNVFSNDVENIMLRMIQNKTIIATVIIINGKVINSGSDTVVVHAEIGDKIYIDILLGDHHTINKKTIIYGMSSFTGILLKTD